MTIVTDTSEVFPARRLFLDLLRDIPDLRVKDSVWKNPKEIGGKERYIFKLVVESNGALYRSSQEDVMIKLEKKIHPIAFTRKDFRSSQIMQKAESPRDVSCLVYNFSAGDKIDRAFLSTRDEYIADAARFIQAASKSSSSKGA